MRFWINLKVNALEQGNFVTLNIKLNYSTYKPKSFKAPIRN